MHNRPSRFGAAFLAGLLAFGLGACSDSGPAGPSGTDFDPEATAQALANVQSELDSDSDVLMSLALVGPALQAEGGASIVLPRQLDGPVTPMAAQVARAYALSGSAAAPIFPSNLLGVTFTWDPGLGRYAVSQLTGAPANGVRFILYAMDPLTRQPVLPLVEIGFVDLTDESDAAATRLGVYAESGGVALIDYVIEGSYATVGQDIAVTLDAAGYFSDGSVRLDFDLSQSATISQTSQTISLDVQYNLSVAGADLSVALDLTGEFSFAQDGGPETAAATLTINNGSDQVVMTLDLAADNTLSGVINYNGAPAVLISGTEADPVFTRPDGEPLTQADMTALTDIFGLLEDVFDFAENLFEPFQGGF
jgi:hypothetical protein